MKSNLLVRKSVKSESPKVAASDVSDKSGMMQAVMNRLVIAIVSGLLIAPLVMFGAAGKVIGPTAESALAADQELARAMRDNDTTGIVRMLDKDWAVIATTGGIGEGPSIFPDGIRSGYLTRKTFSLSEPRVRLYGNTAVVTTKVELSGTFQGKPFEVTERQTDVWYWKDGGWKCILTHETKMPK
jgi:ketosteroid isomerase-like protein